MSSLSAYLQKIQDLTDKNMQILSLINSAFYSSTEHVSAMVGDESYTIPSFLHIENKLNDLEGNWDRLVSSPLKGEAAFILDGSTRKIQITGYETQPPAIDTISPLPEHFSLEGNDVFKDFITPLLYLKMDLGSIPDSVREVSVRKVILKNPALQARMDAVKDDGKAVKEMSWLDAGPWLEGYTEDVDYVLYDKVYRLPLRTVDYDGKFTVTGVDVTQKDGMVYWDGVIDGYTYSYDNGSMTADLKAGDILMSDEASCRMKVNAIDYNARTVSLVITEGYLPSASSVSLRLYVPRVRVNDKYIKVPLEEDSYVMIFISPINTDINTGAMWKGGLAVWADDLTDADGNAFREVYMNKVKNLGDILYDLTSFIDGTIGSLSESDLETLTSVKPELQAASDSSSGDYDVILLNDHLLDNSTVESIRKLNQEKAAINANIQVNNNEIQNIKSQLGNISLAGQDKTVRDDLQKRLDTLNNESASLSSQLMNKINEISQLAESSVLPASNAKYVIRGAVPTDAIESAVSGTGAKVVRIDILYRYKNANRSTSNATAVSDTLTVGDWNKYLISRREKVARWDSTKRAIVYEYEGSVGEDNTAAGWRVFNIPIQQGETVDMRVRVVWDLGWPYVSVVSGWCDVLNVEFPDDLIKYADVKSIVSDNTADADDNIIRQELMSAGVTSHINDMIIDQNLTYFHRPESIASGFYTEDSKRVISLAQKLQEMSDSISMIENGAFGNSYKNLQVTLSDQYSTVTVLPENGKNIFYFPAWNEITGDGGSKKYNVTLTISNINQNSPMNIYSMFPGDLRSPVVAAAAQSKFDYNDYNVSVMEVINDEDNDGVSTLPPQHYGQLIYFRKKNKWTGKETYKYSTNDPLGIKCKPVSWDNIQAPTGTPGDPYTLSGGTGIAIPLEFTFSLDATTNKKKENTIAFDIWNSAFNDPITYEVKFIANYETRGIKRITDATRNSRYNPKIRVPVNSTGRVTTVARSTRTQA